MDNSQIQTEEFALLELMQDIHCFDPLRPWTDKINIFHVLRIARAEIRHSNMLAWLLDPNENHGLGPDFLHAFITDLTKPHSYELIDDTDAIIEPWAAIDLLSSDLNDSQVFREWNHIDILLKLPKDYIIAIENKVDASEGKKDGKSQLENYKTVLENNFDREKITKVFLTPDGDGPSQGNEEWKIYTYSDILGILEEIYKSHQNNLSAEAKILIDNYLGILNNEIMDNTELKTLCNEIYQKHKQALDLIFENRESVTSMASSICFKKLQELKNNNSIELLNDKSGVNIKFTTDWIRKFSNELQGIDVNYAYEFRPFGDYGVMAKLVLVLHNNNKDYNEDLANKINRYARKNQCKKDKVWEWKSIWSEVQKFNEINDDAIGTWVQESLSKLQKFENNS